MRVLHWYANYLTGGAIANTVLGVAAAQARQGTRVTIVAAETRERPLYEPLATRPPGVELVIWRPTSTMRMGGQYLRLLTPREIRRLREIRPDVVHVHGEFNLDNLWVPSLFRCPIVTSPHGAFHPVVLAKSRRIEKRVYLALERQALRRRRMTFHALSPMEREHTVAIFPNASIYCAPQGPGPGFPLSPAHDDEPRNAHRTFTCAFVGRLDVYTKGLDILLDAFARITTLALNAEPRLVLVGPDWKEGRTWLERRIRELEITELVRFSGPLSARGVASVLADCDVYVQLSRHEGFPLSIVEALSASKPAVLSDAIGTVSYGEVADLPHVKVVPPDAAAAGAALAQISEQLPELRAAALGRRAALSDFFSWDRAARLHLDEYARLHS